MVKVVSWGRLEKHDHKIITLSDSHLFQQLKSHTPGLPFGKGRSYGDVCLNPSGVLWCTEKLDRFISFNEKTGVLRCQSGILLRDIQKLIVRRGWILPVTPGTQFITIGGAIANDVHGKNHHVLGSFGHHIRWLKLVRTDGSIIECGPHSLSGWFSAVVGGIGLTGVITEVEIQLQRITTQFVITETIPYTSLEEFFDLADASETEWQYTVSWIDCVFKGKAERGLFMRSNPIELEQALAAIHHKKLITFAMPSIPIVNKLTLRLFNAAYFHIKKKQSNQNITHYESCFYPLDGLNQWNRMYGPRGFFQYQSVVPREVGYDAIKAMLSEITCSGEGSFLSVLKTFGSRPSMGMLSFPMSGVTLALDFPNKGKSTLKLFEKLDAIVREAKGRIYLAKDARMPQDLFEKGYPRFQEFLKYRDPGMSSALSRRLMGS